MHCFASDVYFYIVSLHNIALKVAIANDLFPNNRKNNQIYNNAVSKKSTMKFLLLVDYF